MNKGQDDSANDKQVGGNHYQAAYQHWDLVSEWRLSYLQGCATKYLARYRKKNGVEDLKKAVHYVEKIIELLVQGRINYHSQMPSYQGNEKFVDALKRFMDSNDVLVEDRPPIIAICLGRTPLEFKMAIDHINWMAKQLALENINKLITE